MSAAFGREGYFGFKLQTTKGSYEAPDTWLPLLDLPPGRRQRGFRGIAEHHNYVVLNMADRNAYQSKYFSAGRWVEGSISVPLIPGAVGNLLSWIQGRDTDGQGAWGSVLVDCVHAVKKITDCKVRRARFRFRKSREVDCMLDVAALLMEAGSPTSPSIPTAPPYVFTEAAVQLETGGQGLSADVHCERIVIDIDNVVEEPAEGMRLRESTTPLQLYNLAGVRCTGVFDRDFVDSGVYDDFISGTEAALSIVLQRGTDTCTFTLPRLVYEADSVDLPGVGDERIVERVAFRALGSVDGATAPITLS